MIMSENSSIDHHSKWGNVLREKPELVDEIREMVNIETALPEGRTGWPESFPTGRCWSPKDIPGVAPNTINLLHRRGLLHKDGSNKSKFYSILDLEGAKAALEEKSERFEKIGDDIEKVEYEPPRIPPELFSSIEGYEDIKEVFTWSIEGEEATHIALKGPPASAKSVFLEDIEHYLPRAVYAEGYRSSKAGISDQLLEERPLFFLIDEFGEMHAKHLAVLRGLCGRGRVTETLSGRRRSIYLPTRVYVGCNRWPSDPDGAFRSRFEIFELDKYKPGEFEQISLSTLTIREGIDEDLAEHIVGRLVGKTLDVRKVVAVARIAKNSEDPFTRVDRYLEIKKNRGGVF